ncbi:MAG TPA: DUF4367 domain-containing protein [Symbiobacteriaceae bacterium]|jgi:hypothetical protein
MITEEKIRTVLDAEFPNAEPPLTVWERVKPVIPARAPRRRLSRLAMAAIWGLVVLTGGVAVAATPQVQALLDKYFQKTGIHLVQDPPPPPASATTEMVKVDVSELRKVLPAGMKLPSYLPAPLDGPNTQAAIHNGSLTFGVAWHTAGGSETPFVALSRYNRVFGGEATRGPVQEVQDVKIGQVSTSAYRDDFGWHILWKPDDYEYHLQASNLPLSEVVKVAESLK